MTLEEIKKGLLTAAENKELLSAEEVIDFIIVEMEHSHDCARSILFSKYYTLDYKIREVQAREAQILAFAVFLRKLGVNEIYLAILKDKLSLSNVENLLYRTQEAQKGGKA